MNVQFYKHNAYRPIYVKYRQTGTDRENNSKLVQKSVKSDREPASHVTLSLCSE